MFISRLHTARSLSLLTHILLSASRVPELLFTRNTIANPPSAITSLQDKNNKLLKEKISQTENTNTEGKLRAKRVQ
jgi:hypothetical protein